MRNAAEGESSAAIAQRVVDEFARLYDLLDSWAGHTPWSRDRATALVDAGRAAASSPDVAAIQREAAREALTRLADSSDDGSMRGRHVAADALAFRDREYPAPAPEPPSVTVNGWRVTWDEDAQEFSAWRAGVIETRKSAVSLVLWCSSTGEDDADVVRVLALREGRGDDAQG